MDASSLRCPSCAAAVPTPRPSACQWCGAPLPAAPASTAAPSRAAEFSNLPRELPPMPAPLRSGSGGVFAALLIAAMVAAVVFLFFSARREAPPPDAPSRPSPARPSAPTHLERPERVRSH
jgi:hypothetical protein